MRSLFAVLFALLFGRGLAGQPAPLPSHFRLVQVGDRAFAAIANEGDRSSVGNAGFVAGSDGVLVVDAFATEDAARELLAEIRKRTAAPIRWVVNTHYHYDHLGGDAVFRREGAAVISHDNVRRWTRTENLHWRKEISPADRAMLATLVLPDVTIGDGDRLTLQLGGRTAEVFFRPGHTGGDCVVRVPESDVVFGGDLFWNATVPNTVDANTSAWIDTLDALVRAYPSANFVPGHGEPGRALAVRFFRDYLSTLRQVVAHAIEKKLEGTALADDTVQFLKTRYGAWAWFDQFAAANAVQTEQEMRGTKKTATSFKEKP
ncbi:MAG TPA: MBL fold metallo-hydrolase [Thermoanaerobaculia bacterium]|nr:MBL fold metallo-hydrolase [Thermoanaerobaculia bacterium]